MGEIFREAAIMGIGFILLAGGEPLIRRDVITKATKVKEIIFPVFTNGTMMDNDYMKMFDTYRNIVPIMSLEGNKETTDNRRGQGIFNSVTRRMGEMRERGLLFGVSATVTKRNIEEVTSETFIKQLREKGCRVVIYVEYVPMTEHTKTLAPTDAERALMKTNIDNIRKKNNDMIIIAFPGDEKGSGGCLATGRGFFHINFNGNAEPCPFSPFADTNVKDVGVAGALQSPLFKQLQEGGFLQEEHNGGCVLFNKEAQIKKILEA